MKSSNGILSLYSHGCSLYTLMLYTYLYNDFHKAVSVHSTHGCAIMTLV